MKRCLRLLFILQFAGLPLRAQEAAQPPDALPDSTQSVGPRVPNVTGFVLLSKSTPMELGNYP
jgi:hypothetical protein